MDKGASTTIQFHEYQLPRQEPLKATRRTKCCSAVTTYAKKIWHYGLHVGMVSVKRLITVADVYTDWRTFLILFSDPDAEYYASFLLASIVAPYVIFWASRHNFRSAVLALNEFSVNRPRTCLEKFSRIYYTMLSLPIIGIIATILMVVWWWLVEIVMGVVSPTKYQFLRHYTERRTSSFTDVNLRTITPLMSEDALKFLCICELFYESVPQVILQLWIYLSGESRYFTFQDICLSMGASIVNIIMNVRQIQFAAHSRGMRTINYIIYFMAAELDGMMNDGVPVKLFATSHTLKVCDISSFFRLYCSDQAVHNVCEPLTRTNFSDEKHSKLLILPCIYHDTTRIPIERIVKMALRLRFIVHDSRFERLHVTFNVKMTSGFGEYMCLAERRHIDRSRRAMTVNHYARCVAKARSCMNKASVCMKAGDTMFGKRTRTIDHQLSDVLEHAKMEYIQKYVEFLKPLFTPRRPLSTITRTNEIANNEDLRRIFVLCFYMNIPTFLAIVDRKIHHEYVHDTVPAMIVYRILKHVAEHNNLLADLNNASEVFGEECIDSVLEEMLTLENRPGKEQQKKQKKRLSLFYPPHIL